MTSESKEGHEFHGEPVLGKLMAGEGVRELPPLPEARIESYQIDAVMRKTTLHTYSATDMREYALQAIEHMLRTSGQYITNDASREAALTEAYAEGRKDEREASVWQPIATAPKDGTTVMLWERYNDVPVVGFYSDRRGKWYADTSNYDAKGDAIVIDKLSQELISHWMPLPAAPEVA